MSEVLSRQERELADHLRDPVAKAPPQGVEERRLQVYRDLVYRNIRGFIDSTFPILRGLHDDADWEELVRAFIRDHRCKSPLFLEISEEFMLFLAARGADARHPYMIELAHYEWLELAVDVAEGDVPDPVEVHDPAAASATLAPTARLGTYHYPVHRIGQSFRPTEAGEPVGLLVYRNRDDRVQFMELSPAAARLLLEADGSGGAAVREILLRLAEEWGMDPEATVAFGWDQLQEFARIGAIALRPLSV